MATEPQRILITGASSLIGRYLVPRLQEEPNELVLSSRSRPDWLKPGRGPLWVESDLRDPRWKDKIIAPCTALIHLAPLPLLERAVAALEQRDAARVIAFGTTSRLTKVDSTLATEQQVVHEQIAAEEWLAQHGATSGARWTLFRPTMIYDGIHDKNIALIAGFIRRFGFFPSVGAAAGQRQPVHAADLAEACCAVLDNPETFGRIYNLGGGEVLSYRDMVTRIFLALGKKPRCVRIPPSLLRAALATARIMPRYRYLNAAMADRMNQDMVFDLAAAARDFGYRPGPFRLDFGQDCPAGV